MDTKQVQFIINDLIEKKPYIIISKNHSVSIRHISAIEFGLFILELHTEAIMERIKQVKDTTLARDIQIVMA